MHGERLSSPCGSQLERCVRNQSGRLDAQSEVGVVAARGVNERSATHLRDVWAGDTHPRPRTTDDAHRLFAATHDVAAPRIPRVVVPSVRHLRAVVCHTHTHAHSSAFYVSYRICACNKRFYSGHVVFVFKRFKTFLSFSAFKKVVRSKVWIWKKSRQKNFRGCLSAMIFIDFELLRNPYCKLFRPTYCDKCYDLTRYVAQCAKIIK